MFGRGKWAIYDKLSLEEQNQLWYDYLMDTPLAECEARCSLPEDGTVIA